MERDPLGVLESTRRVVQQGHWVTINEGRLDDLAIILTARGFRPPTWDRSRHFFDGTERTVQFLLVLDALNFCFWGEPEWRVSYQGRSHSGYWALVAALKRAIAEGKPIWKAAYLAQLTFEELGHLLRGEGDVPLLPQRLQILQEVGSRLQQRFDGAFARAIEEARSSAAALVRIVVETFPSFNDVAEYNGKEVRFYKRAQILVADLYGAFEGRGWGGFHDLETLTTFADYKVPQVLRELGAIEYVPPLAEKVDQGM
ncbi:MAG: hypothetical protein HYX89_04245, partial [Chloroflexi bacterium]|nr:hypothetical protein [Chloroflexota bacterium]